MKRWNGWGNIQTDYPLPEAGVRYLIQHLGALESMPDTPLEQALAAAPKSRLPAHPLVETSAEVRLRHARGQSLPDWVDLRFGRVNTLPDGVAFPDNDTQVKDLLEYARAAGAKVIPYGGGTSVVGHINPQKSDAPVLTISLEKMSRLLDLDETSRLATFEAGATGPYLETQLAKFGYTLGHYPQSFEYSTVGGWIATRSSGQQSIHYGRIEGLFAGGRMETPRGRLEMPAFPASAAGPDIKEMALGSEGRMGIITQARLRVRPIPQAESFDGIFFPSWQQGSQAVRAIVQDGIPVSMLRLSNPQETDTTLVLSGKSWVETAKRGLKLIGYGEERCLLIFGATGTETQVQQARQEVSAAARKFGGLFVGRLAGHTWEKSRFLSPYLRNSLWEQGVAIDTLETALPWAQVPEASQAIPAAIVEAAERQSQRVLAFAHLSHLYRDGASIYTTYLFRLSNDPDAILEVWRAMKHSASLKIGALGGTITHQHGVGVDHAPYLPAEKGALGIEAIRSLCRTFDPDEMMNPGKLLE